MTRPPRPHPQPSRSSLKAHQPQTYQGSSGRGGIGVQHVGLSVPSACLPGSVGYCWRLDRFWNLSGQRDCGPLKRLPLHQLLWILPPSELHLQPAAQCGSCYGGLDLHCALSPAPGLGCRNVAEPVDPVVRTPLCSRDLHSGQLPGSKPEAHTPGGSLPCLPVGQPLLLAAASSLLVGEGPAPAWGSLDRATAPDPLQPLHHPHSGHDCPPLPGTALPGRGLRVGRGHDALPALRPARRGLLQPGRLQPVPPASAGAQPPTARLPCVPAGPAVTGTLTGPCPCRRRRKSGPIPGSPHGDEALGSPGGQALGAADRACLEPSGREHWGLELPVSQHLCLLPCNPGHPGSERPRPASCP